jgi:DNA-directed RNA polymerase subunit E'/Rpb7
MLKTITQKISIQAMYLDSNIKSHLLNKIKKNIESKCTFNDGYIIDVKRIISIGDNTIGCANSLVIFNVTYEAEVLKPEEGSILSGKVCMVFQHGIFVDICSKMKVLVPANYINGYKYQEDKNVFEKNGKIIENDREVSIEIVKTKYEKKQFSCIGKLVKYILL